MTIAHILRLLVRPDLRLSVVLALVGSVCNVLLVDNAYGQIVRDGSVGQTAGVLSGPNFTIGVQNSSQQIQGNNLFHSFSQFNVLTGQTATFTGPSSIANIINRVTGQTISTIDGLISSRSAMPNANFFLINPNGMVLGPHASFNVGGSVNLSTADYLRMTDGAKWFSSLAKQSTLSSAPVTAFGFLGEHTPGPITVQAGNPIVVNEGTAISLVGGDVSIAGRALSSPGGLLSIISAGGANVPPVGVEISPSLTYQPTSLASQGQVTLDGITLQSSSNTFFTGAGTILISGGKLVLRNATVQAIGHGFNSGESPVQAVIPKSGDIKIFANEGTIQGSSLQTGISGSGANNILSAIGGMVSGNIEFNGGALAVSNTTMNTTPTADKAGVGSVNIRGDSLVTLVDTNISVDANTQLSTTNGGSITIHAGDLQLLSNPGTKNPTMLSTKSFTILDPVISGGVLLEAAKTILIRGAIIQTSVGSGEGGNISLTAGHSIQLADSSSIRASSLSAGTGGNISAAAPVIDIQGSEVTAKGGIANGSGFLTDASGGSITLNAKSLVHLNDSTITTSVIGGAGGGGNITIDPDAVVVQNSQILAQAIQGRGGAIKISAGILLVDPSSLIKADSQNQALNGTINIQAPIQQLSGAIAPLPQVFAVATNLYGQRCATQKGGQFSSFVQGARDGVPPQPGDLIPSPLLQESDGTSPSLGVQSSPNLAAVRLGLPDFDHPVPATFMLSAGCRS